MRTQPITAEDLAAKLIPLGADAFPIRMAVGMLLTPNGHGGVLADAVADFITVGNGNPTTVDWPGLRAALDGTDLGLTAEQARLMRLAAAVAQIQW
jgi:hypothetical protein